MGNALALVRTTGLVTRAYGTRAVWLPVAGVATLTTLGYLALHRYDGRRTGSPGSEQPEENRSALS